MTMKIDTGEKLAQLWYETSVRVDPPRNPTPWDSLPVPYKNSLILVAIDVLKEIVVGVLGEPMPDDQGRVMMAITSNAENIRIDFGAELTWLSMPKPEAINFAVLMLKHCGVPVNILVAPVPPDPPPPAEPPPGDKPV
jgi:hypothetical protein